MPLQTYNYAALPLREGKYDWLGNLFENMNRGDELRRMPGMRDRAEQRDKVDTNMYQPTKEQELMKLMFSNRGLDLSNQRDEATLPFVAPKEQAMLQQLLQSNKVHQQFDAPEHQADLRARQLGNQKLGVEIPLTKEQMLIDMMYKRAMANRMMNPGNQSRGRGLSENEAKAISGAENYVNSNETSTLTKPQINQHQKALISIDDAIKNLEKGKKLGDFLSTPDRAIVGAEGLANSAGGWFKAPSVKADAESELNNAVEKLMSISNLPRVQESMHMVKSTIFPHSGESKENYVNRIESQIEDLKNKKKEIQARISGGISLNEEARGIKSADQLMNSKVNPATDPNPEIRALASHFNQTANKLKKMRFNPVTGGFE